MKIRLFDNDSFVVDYDKKEKSLTVSYFEDNHFCDGIKLPANVECYNCKWWDFGCKHPLAEICEDGELRCQIGVENVIYNS